jgi:hypothetical protein
MYSFPMPGEAGSAFPMSCADSGCKEDGTVLGKISLLLASTLLTLLGFEVAARLELLPLPEFVVSDAWWQERWHRKRRGLNPRQFVQLDSDLGFVPAAGLEEFEYQGVRISTNSAHMRGKREYPVERTGETRIVVVGDSFTFGQCVEDAGTFPAVMEQILPNTEVLNLGVMGYGQDQALLRMRRDGFRYSPDIVVFGFHSSDMRRNLVSFRGYGKPRFRMTESGLQLENVPVPRPEEYERWWPPRLWNFVRIFLDSLESGSPEQKAHIRDLSRAIVHQMALEAEAQGVKFVLVHLPSRRTLETKGIHGWSWMERLCTKEKPTDFLCVSPVQRFREIVRTPEDVRHHFDCHFSPELYRAVGEVLAEALLAEFPELFGPRPGEPTPASPQHGRIRGRTTPES